MHTTSTKPFYLELAEHYERCFAEHGATPKGVDWPNLTDLETRFKVMLELCVKPLQANSAFSLLDLGCGYGALLDYIERHSLVQFIDYTGIDISANMIDVARARWPETEFIARDILLEPLPIASVDYVVMNGLFTEKRGLTQDQMEAFLGTMLSRVFASCRIGMAFNVMSYHVDWFREDLFHLSFDRLATILQEHTSRHFMIRADYGLYEYTVYVYKHPN